MTIRPRVVRFDHWTHPTFDQRMKAAADVDLLVQPMPANLDQAAQGLAGAHVYHVTAAKDELSASAFVTAELLAACPDLLCASSTGAGFDPIDVAACTRAGVAVVNQSGGNAVSVAEHALGLIIGLAHRITESDRKLRRERGFSREDLTGRELAGKTVGVVGIGNTGRRVAALVKAFGMQVLATDPLLSDDEIRSRGATPVSLDELLASSDFVSLHCPRDAATRGMIGASAFARMKRGAYFVTTARGGIHDEAALHTALKSGHLAGAGLDVWDQEPPPLDSPLLSHDNVIATYHTAGVTHECRETMASWSADQILGVVRGERAPRLVNPEVWPAYVKRFEAILKRPVQGAV
jgi:D-3-phosphoglycerate dehydrogenase